MQPIMNNSGWAANFDQAVEDIRMAEADAQLECLAAEAEQAEAQEQQQATVKDEASATSQSLPSAPEIEAIEPEACPICRDDSEQPQDDFVSLPCAGAHRAHPECFKHWIESKSAGHDKCPMCRQPLYYSCEHLIDVNLLVAGTVIPQQILQGPCKANCPGTAEMYQYNRSQFTFNYRRAMLQVGAIFHSPRILRLDPDRFPIAHLHRLNHEAAHMVFHYGDDVAEWEHEEEQASRASPSNSHQAARDRLHQLYRQLGFVFIRLERYQDIVDGDMGRHEDEAWWQLQNETLGRVPDSLRYFREQMQELTAERQARGIREPDDGWATDNEDDDYDDDYDDDFDDDEPPAAAPSTPIAHDWNNHTWSGPSIAEAQPGNNNAGPAEDWSNAISSGVEHQEQQLVQAPVAAAPSPSTPFRLLLGLAAIAGGALALIRNDQTQQAPPSVPLWETLAASRENELSEDQAYETALEDAEEEETEEETDWPEQSGAEQERRGRRQEGPKL